jgi:hypothetical protein
MRVAYADPPYLGCGRKFYDRPEWDRLQTHLDLLAQLIADFPDGWALSAHTPSLQAILPFCPTDVRIAAWVKPMSWTNPGVNPIYAWEPVIYRGGRRGRSNRTVVYDWLAASSPANGFVGQKPRKFCLWLFNLLGLQPQDELVDLFPGSGAVSIHWREFIADQRSQAELFAELVR